jgi:hypothetical protein
MTDLPQPIAELVDVLAAMPGFRLNPRPTAIVSFYGDGAVWDPLITATFDRVLRFLEKQLRPQ